MSLMQDVPTDETVVAHWYDSDLPSERTRALVLIRSRDGSEYLAAARRETPADMWPVLVIVSDLSSLAQASAVADLAGLDPYLVREEAPASPLAIAREVRRV